ncbi:MAG: hypothetical protein AAF368_00585 [Planctomycetota bacterium]
MNSRLIEARRKLVRKAPYRALQAAYYTHYQLRVRPQRRTAGQDAGLRDGPALKRIYRRNSDRLFILGSGWSINEMDPARLREIAAADTFGFNLWVRHPFVPSLYTVELANFAENPLGRPVARRIADLLDRRPEYRSVPIVFSDYEATRRECLDYYPRWVRESAFSLNTIPAIARNRLELDRSLITLSRMGVFAVGSNLTRVFKYRATLSMLIALGAGLGYREIVLCGIDINDPRYFYQDAETYPDMTNFWSSPRRERHNTAYASPMQVSIMDVVFGMDEEILKPRGIRLFVENSSSALHPRVPVFRSA